MTEIETREADLKEQRETWEKMCGQFDLALKRAMTAIGQIEDALNDPLCADREDYLFRIIYGVKEDVAKMLDTTNNGLLQNQAGSEQGDK